MSDDPQRGNPLETAPIPTLLLRYSVPTALTLMVNFLYNIVDQIFIGRGVGISGMTATNIAFPLVILVGAVSLLLGDGCAAYVSLALGRRQQAEADAAVGQTVTLLLVSGIVLAALSALLAPQLVWLLGTTETAYAQSVAYLRTIAVGIPFQLLCPALTAIVRADGSPQYTMRCMLAGALLNVALDALFIFPLAMGVVGAGIATVIGEAVSALLFLRYLPHMKTVQVRLRKPPSRRRAYRADPRARPAEPADADDDRRRADRHEQSHAQIRRRDHLRQRHRPLGLRDDAEDLPDRARDVRRRLVGDAADQRLQLRRAAL